MLLVLRLANFSLAISMRVIAKNLPLALSEEDIRKHFSDCSVPTDVRLLRDPRGNSRRVAFIGYKSEEAAMKSIVHYNKSYCQGHRLAVESAFRKEQTQLEPEKRKQKTVDHTGISVLEMKDIVELLQQKKKKNTLFLDEGCFPEDTGSKTGSGTTSPQKNPRPETSFAEIIAAHREEAEKAKKERVRETGEVFVRGLPYTATESEIESAFSAYGPIAEVYVKQKDRVDAWGEGTPLNYGYALITFSFPADAYALIGKEIVFQGRNVTVHPSHGKSLPVSPSASQPRRNPDTVPPYNALLFNFSAVLGVAAKARKATKREILADSGRGLGGRMALLESELIESTKAFIEKEGIATGCKCKRKKDNGFSGMHPGKRSQEANAGCACAMTSRKSLLIKNIPFGASEIHLRPLFRRATRIVFAPSKTLAVAEYSTRSDAKKEQGACNFSMVKDHPVYVEYLKVTQERFLREEAESGSTQLLSGSENLQLSSPAEKQKETVPAPEPGASVSKIIVKNFPFQAGRSEMSEIIEGIVGKEYKLRFPVKADGTHRGFCFIELPNPNDVDVLLSRLAHVHLYGRHLVTERAVL